jgi:hypothetical protein
MIRFLLMILLPSYVGVYVMFKLKVTALAPTINGTTTHLQLLTATLEIFSSLAAHAEVNGTSGSKLCKLFGLWLLTAHRVEDKDDWKTFYARWERTGRMLEHLFLSRIRQVFNMVARSCPTESFLINSQRPIYRSTHAHPSP